MTSPLSNESSSGQLEGEIAYHHDQRRRRPADIAETTVYEPGYLFRLGRSPVNLTWIEYQMVRFLSASPYKPFTRKQIADSIRSPKCMVAEDQIDDHVRTLRDKLGIFSDYVQSVPYIGYRFKP
jgi:DNA-binding response OmpR family regulator